jgi:hypothetical protein
MIASSTSPLLPPSFILPILVLIAALTPLQYAAVRANRLAVAKELLEDYPVDGIDIDFATFAPFLRHAEVAEHTASLTAWLREIRASADAAAEAQGRPKRVVVRVPATIRGNELMGQDVLAWVREGLCDTVIAFPESHTDFSASVSSLCELAAACAEHGVPVIACLDTGPREDCQTPEVHRAATVNAYAAGARGIGFHQWYPEQTGRTYPYTPADYDRIRYAAYPDALAHKDKTFRLGTDALTRPDANLSLPGVVVLPAVLTAGAPGPRLQLEVAENIVAAATDGTLWRCELLVGLKGLAYTDTFVLRWNGKEVPAAAIRKADWTYQMRGSVRGYRLHVDLQGAGMLPRRGVNTASVDLLTKDATLVLAVEVVDVQVVVQYLPHRNGIRDDEDFYRPGVSRFSDA